MRYLIVALMLIAGCGGTEPLPECPFSKASLQIKQDCHSHTADGNPCLVCYEFSGCLDTHDDSIPYCVVNCDDPRCAP